MHFLNLKRLSATIVLMSVIGLLVISSSGCEEKTVQRLTINDSQSTSPTSRAFPCTVLVIGKPEITESLQRQWSARQDSEFNIKTTSIKEISAADFEIPQDVDVLVYPAQIMIELIHRGRITELKTSVYESDEFNKNDLLKHFRKSGIRYDSKTWAIPCGGPLFALIYQPDALKRTKTQIPETWSQLIRWAERLAEQPDVNSDGAQTGNTKTKQSIAVPLAKGWAAKTFIAIAAPYARQKGRLSVLFQRRTMKPLITSEAFVRALDELKALSKLNPANLNMTPPDVLKALVDGELAAGITWPTSTVSPTADETASQTLLIHSLPGSSKYFDESTQSWGTRQTSEPNVVDLHGMNGLLASQTKTSRRPQSAAEFLKWLPESSISQTLFSTDNSLGPFRTTHLGDTKSWIGDHFSREFETAFANQLKSAHDQALIMTLPKILRAGEYLEILDAEIRAALTSDLPSKTTLEKVATAWEALTEEIGRKTQSDLLRRNSNF